MSMDAARARFPECPQCGIGVDENDPDIAYYIIDGDHYHAKCLDEEITPCDRCGVHGWPGDNEHPCLCCETCEGAGDGSVHGVEGECGACNGTGRRPLGEAAL